MVMGLAHGHLLVGQAHEHMLMGQAHDHRRYVHTATGYLPKSGWLGISWYPDLAKWLVIFDHECDGLYTGGMCGPLTKNQTDSMLNSDCDSCFK